MNSSSQSQFIQTANLLVACTIVLAGEQFMAGVLGYLLNIPIQSEPKPVQFPCTDEELARELQLSYAFTTRDLEFLKTASKGP